VRPDDRALPAGLPAEPDRARLHQVQDPSLLQARAADDRGRGQTRLGQFLTGRGRRGLAVRRPGSPLGQRAPAPL